MDGRHHFVGRLQTTSMPSIARFDGCLWCWSVEFVRLTIPNRNTAIGKSHNNSNLLNNIIRKNISSNTSSRIIFFVNQPQFTQRSFLHNTFHHNLILTRRVRLFHPTFTNTTTTPIRTMRMPTLTTNPIPNAARQPSYRSIGRRLQAVNRMRIRVAKLQRPPMVAGLQPNFGQIVEKRCVRHEHLVLLLVVVVPQRIVDPLPVNGFGVLEAFHVVLNGVRTGRIPVLGRHIAGGVVDGNAQLPHNVKFTA